MSARVSYCFIKMLRFSNMKNPVSKGYLQLVRNVETMSLPCADNEMPPVSPKIAGLASDIGQLTLVEVAELTTVLKKQLNLPDAPVMSFGSMAPGGAFGAAAQEEEEEPAPKVVKTSFSLKLNKYDETKKVALIKEIKNLMEDMNLVQAKKFVESAPTVVKADMTKDEAEKLKEMLEKVGAECELE